MASAKFKDSLVGFELSGDRLRLAAFTGTNSASRATVPRRLHCEEIVIPDAEAYSPASLPPANLPGSALVLALVCQWAF